MGPGDLVPGCQYLDQEFKDYKGDNGRKSKNTALLNLDLL
jgi:hypothetical protein